MIKLRPASEKDCRLIWKWANDPDVRAVSFSQEAIVYENHIKWFETRLNNPNCYFYIAEDSNQESIGQIRFELKSHEAHISISLDHKFRGRGQGSEIIALASKTFLGSTDAQIIHAYIKKDNTASLAAFKKAGFTSEKNLLVKNRPVHHLILTRENVS